MQKLKDYRRVFDIELTNRCNALCTFCPRDETPQQGFMTFETFKKSVERAAELDVFPDMNSTGQGEPTLHPQLIQFAEYARSLNLPYSMTTNGSLLTEELAEGLINAGLHRINFSISDLGEDYEEVYALNFNTTKGNIFRFLEMNKARGKPVEVWVNLVEHDLNRDKLKQYRKFWIEAGVDWFINFKQNNRGGACANGDYFLQGEEHKSEAEKILAEQNISPICAAPFTFVFVGWNGQYYICCNDYRKTTPLGSIFDFSVEEMDVIKRKSLCSNNPPQACIECNLDKTNRVREKLYEMDMGDATQADMDNLITELREREKSLPDIIQIK